MNGDSAAWTIDRLARLAAAALADGAPTQPNGRIREVPDVRTIRWYTSIGLLGRPAAMRGRTALYGRSHLAQLVAIKRLQASGLTVAAVQERLLGAEAAAVEEIAMLPADLGGLVAQVEADESGAAPEARRVAAPAARTRFWADTSLSADTESTSDAAPTASVSASAGTGTASAASVSASADTGTASAASVSASADTGTASAASPASSTIEPALAVHGLRLAPDVTLLLPPGRVPDAAARAAIAEAARPLLDLLDRLGLSGS